MNDLTTMRTLKSELKIIHDLVEEVNVDGGFCL
jgi:hypothetical protein